MNPKIKLDILEYLFQLRMDHGDDHFSVGQISRGMRINEDKLYDYITKTGYLVDLRKEGFVDEVWNIKTGDIMYKLTPHGEFEVIINES